MVFKAATRSEEFFDHLRAHYREAKRRDVDIEAEVRLIGEKEVELDRGTARVANVSPSGALLEDIRLSKESFPAVPFRLAVAMKGGDYDGIGLTCRPVRLVPEKTGLGVAFEEIFVPLNSIVPMVNPNDIVVGGWDCSSKNLVDSMRRAAVMDINLWC